MLTTVSLVSGGRSLDTAWGTMRKVRVPVMPDRMSHTSFTDLPRISMPFTSSTSSPSWSRPLFSAAPPRTIRPIITASPSFRTVAPYNTHKQMFDHQHHYTCRMNTVSSALFYTFLYMWNRWEMVRGIKGLGRNGWNCSKRGRKLISQWRSRLVERICETCL